MNRDDVIRMARETGLDLYINDVTEEPYATKLERFANLVAADAYEKGWNDAMFRKSLEER
jgi:hypothetical protein